MNRLKALPLFGTAVAVLAMAYLLYSGHYTHWWQWLQNTAMADTEALTIGIVRPASRKGDLLLDGAQLAVNQINAKGGLLGQPFRLIHQIDPEPRNDGFLYYDNDDDGREIATTLVNQGVIAVIGHGSLHSAKSAAIIYDENQVLFLLPYASDNALTTPRQPLVFRIVPSSLTNNKGMAQYMMEQGYCRIVTLWMQNPLGKESSHIFSRLIQSQGGTVALSHSFPEHTQDFQPLILALLGTEALDLNTVDAIYLIGKSENFKRFVAKARYLGIRLPIIGSESTSEFRSTNKPDQLEANTARYAHTDHNTFESYQQQFIEAFMQQYKRPPNFWAMLGYDAVMMISQAITKTSDKRPVAVAKHLQVLKYTKPYSGVSGRFTFDGSGDLEAKAIYVSEVKDDLSLVNKAIVLGDFDSKSFANNCYLK